jgi:hypothetical protein
MFEDGQVQEEKEDEGDQGQEQENEEDAIGDDNNGDAGGTIDLRVCLNLRMVVMMPRKNLHIINILQTDHPASI